MALFSAVPVVLDRRLSLSVSLFSPTPLGGVGERKRAREKSRPGLEAYWETAEPARDSVLIFQARPGMVMEDLGQTSRCLYPKPRRSTMSNLLTFRTHPLGAYADQSPSDEGESFVIPESFDNTTDEELAQLQTQSQEAFQALYGDGSSLSDDDLSQLAKLTEAIQSLNVESEARENALAERKTRAAELAQSAGIRFENEQSDEGEFSAKKTDTKTDTDEDQDEDEPSEDDEDSENPDETEEEKARRKKREEAEDDNAGDTSSLSNQRRSSLRVNVPARRSQSHHLPERTSDQKTSVTDVVFAAGEGSGYNAGQGINLMDAATIASKRMSGYKHQAFASAARNGRTIQNRQGIMSIQKPFSDDQVIQRQDAQHIEDVLRRATDEHRLQGSSLVASGGWCAPSETLYDLLELESNDGLFSIPEVQVTRGGITRTLGPNFADIYNQIEGFYYTEQEDIDGNYDGEGGGSKPCVRVTCPDFEEFRLDVVGLCIQAGLLQNRAYPEVIARVLRGALVAHNHRMANRSLTAIEAGSRKITMPSESGVTAPILSAIEKQVEHMRYSQRIARSTTLEAIFPFWVRGAIREDLSKRNGVELLSVTDQQIQQWFAMRGVNPQFVYNWQDVNGLESTNFTAWPNQVKFLLYPAGSWVRGSSDIITVDTLFDSTLLGTNDYSALFTEEGHMVVPMGHDSRAVTVPLDASGVSAEQIDLSRDGLALPTSGPAFAEPSTPSIIEAPTPAAPVVGDEAGE